MTQSLEQWIYFSEEVKEAKQSRKPIVALESTIISHGMPYPTNVQTAREVEEIVRSYGAVPATIAVLNGRIQIGLSDEDLEFLGRPENRDSIVKVSRRDLAYVLAQGRSGATTVAATMICANLAGIEVFVTGGIGGVHRGAEQTMDISADLTGLAHTNVAVVCAGAKSNTSQAATRAGLNVLGVLQEPIAAALAYGIYAEENLHNENIMVFDLGGGTFDLTIFRVINDAKKLEFEVLATSGDDRLGGLDFDKALAELIQKKSGLNLTECSTQDLIKGEAQLMEAARDAKEILSFEEYAEVIRANVLQGQHIEVEISRQEFENCIASYFDKMDAIIDDVLGKAFLPRDAIARVIKVGGSSRIPKVDTLLEEKVGQGKTYGNIDPDRCVAEGASIYAAYLDGRLEWSKQIEIKTATAHALGVALGDGRFSVLIPSNRRTPCEETRIFTTNVDNCEALDIDVYQGASKFVIKNKKIGRVHVEGLVQRPKGELDIEITFRISQQQNVSVTVRQRESGIRKMENLKLA